MNAKHETRDADVGSLFLIAVILFLGGGVVCLGVWALMHLLATKEAAHERPSPVSSVVSTPSEPRLETQPGVDLEQTRIREEAQLNSYGWIDGNSSQVHIPIDRAMELIIARGLPDIGANQTPLQLMQARSHETRSSPLPR
jgi:hypothetical protein